MGVAKDIEKMPSRIEPELIRIYCEYASVPLEQLAIHKGGKLSAIVHKKINSRWRKDVNEKGKY